MGKIILYRMFWLDFGSLAFCFFVFPMRGDDGVNWRRAPRGLRAQWAAGGGGFLGTEGA